MEGIYDSPSLTTILVHVIGIYPIYKYLVVKTYDRTGW